MNIGDLILRLLADGSKLQASVVAEAGKAGDAGAQTLGQKLSSGLKTGGMKAFGAATTAAFALATKGALQLEDVQLRIQAETGASAEEAARAASAINKAAGDNQVALESVAQAAIAVRQNLGATGDEADQLTADFVRFARVTRQDAAAAVTDFDDILDAWGLTTADATRLMDQLKLSQERYGGSLSENQRALAVMAPALRALNADVDDGIALLNLFAANGLDAAAAQRGLNTAVANLPPGTNLADIVAEIAAIEDPARRAQRAVEIFGSRAGVGLANALHPGVNSLDGFAVTATEAAGTVGRAADVIDSKWFGIPKMLSRAGAAIRDLGKDLGPLLAGAGGLASLATTLGLDKPLAAAWKAAAGSTVVQGAVKFAADKAATVYLQALIASDMVGAALSKLWGAIPGSAAVGGAIKTAGSALGGLLAGSVVAALAAGIGTFLAGLSIAELIKENSGMSEAEWQAQVTANYARMGGMSPEAARNLAAGNKNVVDWQKRDMIDQFHQSGGDIADGITQTVDWAAADAIARSHMSNEGIGEQVDRDIATGISKHQEFVQSALTNLRDLMENVLGRRKRIGMVVGDLVSQDLADALDDKRGRVRHAAEQTQLALLDELERMIAKGGKIGDDAMEKLRDALHSKNPRIRAAAQQIKAIVDAELAKTKESAGNAGTRAGTAFGANLAAAINRSDFRVSANVDVNARYGAGHRASGGPVLAGSPYWVNEDTPRTEMIVPSTDGYVLTHSQAMAAVRSAAASAGSGDTYNFPPVTVQGALPVRTPRDIVTELRRVAELGQLPPPTLSPKYHRREARA